MCRPDKRPGLFSLSRYIDFSCWLGAGRDSSEGFGSQAITNVGLCLFFLSSSFAGDLGGGGGGRFGYRLTRLHLRLHHLGVEQDSVAGHSCGVCRHWAVNGNDDDEGTERMRKRKGLMNQEAARITVVYLMPRVSSNQPGPRSLLSLSFLGLSESRRSTNPPPFLYRHTVAASTESIPPTLPIHPFIHPPIRFQS